MLPPPTHKPNEVRKLTQLIFAPPGNGKTHFVGTATEDPRTAPLLLVDFEGGTSTLVGLDVEILSVRDWKDFWDLHTWLKLGTHHFKSTAIDSISESHIFALLRQLDSSTRSRRIDDLLEQGDYGIALVQMRRLLRAFRDLPLHFFATSLVKEAIDPMTGVIYKPSLAGALADEAPGIFDVVSYLAMTSIIEPEETEPQVHRVMVLQNYPQYRTKVRTPRGVAIPNDLIDPTVTKLMDLLHIPQGE